MDSDGKNASNKKGKKSKRQGNKAGKSGAGKTSGKKAAFDTPADEPKEGKEFSIEEPAGMNLDETNDKNVYRASMKKKKKEREKNREKEKEPVEEEPLDVRIARMVKYGRIMYWSSFGFTVLHAFLMVAF
jgi:hypothetical protein